MEETPVTQYIFAPGESILHLIRNEGLTVCGRHVLGKPEERRRRDDLRIITEKPEGQFVLPCSKCRRIAAGIAEPELAPLSLRHCRMSHPNYRDIF